MDQPHIGGALRIVNRIDPSAGGTLATDPRRPAATFAAGLADRYRLERQLGEGGMATVWLAEDIRHHRKVAIKVLHPELSAVLGPERFLKEIELTANLQHPHILPLFDSGAAGGLLYYVMPFVDGETLRARLERERQLPVAEAVRLTSDVADAVGYAHARGVVHRDIKPENILLHGAGGMGVRPLLADFGIALAVEHAGGTRLTHTGLSLGTPEYMAPEQAMGERSVDHRADIYALGAVLYEMLAGEPPFSGPTAQATVARVMTEAPLPLRPRRSTVPEHVESAVLTALEKLPADRPPSAEAFRAALADGESAVRPRRTASLSASDGGLRRWRVLAFGAALLAVVATGAAVAAWSARPSSTASRVVRFHIDLPPTDNSTSIRLALSRDGHAIAYIDQAPGPRGGIYLRRLDRTDPALVAGTSGARTLTFSPTDSSLGFVTASRELRVTAREGGTPVTIAREADFFEGIDWGSDGHLYFVSADSGVVSRVPATGGAVEYLGTLEDSSKGPFGFRNHGNPRLLRDGRAVLFSIWRGPGGEGDIGVVDLKTRKTRLLTTGRHAVGVHAGHLIVVAADGALRAMAFDVDQLEVRGAAVPLLSGIKSSEASAQIALADDGTLAYIPEVAGRSELVWVSRAGIAAPINPSIQKPFDAVAISPRGDRVALSAVESTGASSVWLYDLRQHTITRFAHGGAITNRPRWTSDGASVVFVSDRGSDTRLRALWLQPVDGRDTATLFVRSGRPVQEVSLAPDGRWIVYREGHDDGRTLRDLRYVRQGPDTTSRPFAATTANEQNPALSPDGRWLAWVSNESGRDEVYVAPFPGPGGRIVVSPGGGSEPVWARSGRELFYRALDGQLVSVEFAAGARPQISSRRALFDATPYAAGTNYAAYDVAPDGRFLFVKRPPDPGAQVVVNWMTEVAPRLRLRP